MKKTKRKAKDVPPSVVSATEKRKADWDLLVNLISEYVDASIQESWKGGGDPLDIPVLEARLTLQRLILEAHIASMRRFYED